MMVDETAKAESVPLPVQLRTIEELLAECHSLVDSLEPREETPGGTEEKPVAAATYTASCVEQSVRLLSQRLRGICGER